MFAPKGRVIYIYINNYIILLLLSARGNRSFMITVGRPQTLNETEENQLKERIHDYERSKGVKIFESALRRLGV